MIIIRSSHLFDCNASGWTEGGRRAGTGTGWVKCVVGRRKAILLLIWGDNNKGKNSDRGIFNFRLNIFKERSIVKYILRGSHVFYCKERDQ